MEKAKFSPSLMCMDFLNIREQIEILNEKADYYHADVMDGHYCKNITLSPDMIRAFSKVTSKPIDVHLMTTNPADWIEVAAKAGAAYISVHAETINREAFRILQMIEDAGCEPGIVLNPATPLQEVKYYMDRIKMLTIMTVDVGFSRQSFIPEVLHKIKEASALKEANNYEFIIQVDGACNQSTFKKLNDAGAEVYVMGASGLFGLHQEVGQAYDMMLKTFAKETNLLERAF